MPKKKVLGKSSINPDKLTVYAPAGTRQTLRIFAGRKNIKVNDIFLRGIDLAMAAIERGA